MGLPSEAGIPELWDTSILVISGTYTDAVCSPLPYHGPGETVCSASVPASALRPNQIRGHGSVLQYIYFRIL